MLEKKPRRRLRLTTQKTYGVLKVVLLMAGVFALVAFGLFMLQLRETAKDLQQTSAVSRQAILDTRVELKGMVQNTNAILLQVGLAADETRQASAEQRAELKVLNKKMEGAFDQLTADLKTFNDVQLSAKAALDRVPPLLDATTETVKSTNKVISDPNIPATFENTQKITGNIAGITDQANKTTVPSINKSFDHIEKMLADGEHKAHQLAYPSKKAQVWGYTKEVLFIFSRFLTF